MVLDRVCRLDEITMSNAACDGFLNLQTYVRPRSLVLNPLTPNDLYKRRTAQLTSRCCILYIYSTNMRTVYFKHAA